MNFSQESSKVRNDHQGEQPVRVPGRGVVGGGGVAELRRDVAGGRRTGGATARTGAASTCWSATRSGVSRRLTPTHRKWRSPGALASCIPKRPSPAQGCRRSSRRVSRCSSRGSPTACSSPVRVMTPSWRCSELGMWVPQRAHSGGQPSVGALSLIRSDPAWPFTAGNVALAKDLGGRMGTAVENARLFQEVQAWHSESGTSHALLDLALTAASIVRSTGTCVAARSPSTTERARFSASIGPSSMSGPRRCSARLWSRAGPGRGRGGDRTRDRAAQRLKRRVPHSPG